MNSNTISKQLIIVILTFFCLNSCVRKEEKLKNNDNKNNTQNTGLASSTTTFTPNINSLEWIGAHYNDMLATTKGFGTYIAKFDSKSKELTMLKKYTRDGAFSAAVHSIDDMGNIYFFSATNNSKLGACKIDINGNVIWSKKYNIQLSQYNNESHIAPKTIKAINGYVWALSSLFLLKIDINTGEVINSSGISNTGELWTAGEDVIKAGNNIMVLRGGGDLHYYILDINTLKPIKTVLTKFNLKGSTGFKANNIFNISDNKFYAIAQIQFTDRFSQKPLLIEFNEDGKIIKCGEMTDVGTQFGMTRVHKSSDGRLTATYNNIVSEFDNIKTHDVLIFDQDFELINKASLDYKYKSSAIAFDNGMAALLYDNNYANTLVEWVNTSNPICHAARIPTNLKVVNFEFKEPEIDNNNEAIPTHIKYISTEDMNCTYEDIPFTSKNNECKN